MDVQSQVSTHEALMGSNLNYGVNIQDILHTGERFVESSPAKPPSLTTSTQHGI